MSEDDPLNDLYTEESPFDRQRLAEVLGQYIQIDPDTGEPNATVEFNELPEDTQTVALLLYRRAAVEMGAIEEPAPIDGGWIEERFPRKDIWVADLDEGLPFVQVSDGSYHIPTHLVDEAVEWLSE